MSGPGGRPARVPARRARRARPQPTTGRRLSLRGQLGTQLALAVVGLFVLAPVWILVLLASEGSIRGLPREFRLLPAEPTLVRFAEAWVREGHDLDFLGLLRNSLFVSGLSAAVALGFGASMAYAFARMRFPGARVGLFAVLFGALLPPIVLATPLFVVFLGIENVFPALRTIGFRGSTLALAIVYAAFAMPLCVWLMRAAFQAVPGELEEAAFVDGAGRLTAFRRISLPIAAPSILVAGLVAFLLGYTEFALAWLFASSERNLTLAMILASAQEGFYQPDWGATAAHALLMTVPVVALFVGLQRILLRTTLAGTATD